MDHGAEPFRVVCRGGEDTRCSAEDLRRWIACVFILVVGIDVITVGYVFVCFLSVSWGEIGLCHVERFPDSGAEELLQWLARLFLN
ncbi:hypothetical protein BDV39DRAFT_183777 [Aspergillus sergii]|uniref:Transmembrane protein n=1 Tax=Aspergillus sergii TaxID=1034303 RepID=A0A5N6WPL6_9EURO|nr:hypothetical protein BDV39DRAFT_183777 [Aspergillus sergii]